MLRTKGLKVQLVRYVEGQDSEVEVEVEVEGAKWQSPQWHLEDDFRGDW